MSDLHHSPLEACHVTLGAKLVSFAGWSMPIQYTSIMEEHHAVRNEVGIFDISHMGQVIVEGAGAESWLNRMLTNNVSKLAIGQGQYSLMLNETGGVIDDLIIYRTGENRFFLVINASMIDVDVAWLNQHLAGECTLLNESDRWAGMAVQGPAAAAAFAKAFPDQALPPRNGITSTPFGHLICRTGYTGEDGFEYFCPKEEGSSCWEKFLSAGAKPCGLGARDSLRLEMGYPLNGNDLSPDRTPIEAGLGFFCDLDKPDFFGKEILVAQKANGTDYKLAALKAVGKAAPPRAHYAVLDSSGNPLGELCSGVLSPSLMTGIAMAYLPAAQAQIGTQVQVDVRGRLFPFEVVKKPFLKKS